MATIQSLLAMARSFAGGAGREEGQTMAEYGLLLAGIAVIALAGVTVLGPAIRDLFISLVGSF